MKYWSTMLLSSLLALAMAGPALAEQEPGDAAAVTNDNQMATFVVLFRFTDQGLRNIKDSPDRVLAAQQVFQEMGATVKLFYALLGEYDTMFIVEAPNAEIVAEAVLAVASAGNVRPETMFAFTVDEFRRLVDAIP